ncbi:DUF3800 domain-containing protein [soil metagenome]
MKILFVDESGDHNLSIIDPSYPLFVLGGIIIEKNYAEEELVEIVNKFKIKMFGNSEIILHTADISRNRNGFERLIEKSFREKFYLELNALIKTLKFTAVACVIKKDTHLSRYGLAALDPYFLSLDILVERFCMEIGNTTSGGVIVAERRDPTLDHELDLAWLNLKIQGTHHMSAKKIEKRIIGLNLRSKSENLVGLQLADLMVSPIGRFVLGKSVKEDFKIIQSKFRCNKEGEWRGYGLVILPK